RRRSHPQSPCGRGGLREWRSRWRCAWWTCSASTRSTSSLSTIVLTASRPCHRGAAAEVAENSPGRPIAVTTLPVGRQSCDSRGVIALGQPAPAAASPSRDGGAVRLSDFWREKPTILLFLRHFG